MLIPTRRWPVWQDWAIYWTLGNFLQPLATLNLPNSLTFLGNFYKGVKLYHISSEIILGQLLLTFGDFFLVTMIPREEGQLQVFLRHGGRTMSWVQVRRLPRQRQQFWGQKRLRGRVQRLRSEGHRVLLEEHLHVPDDAGQLQQELETISLRQRDKHLPAVRVQRMRGQWESGKNWRVCVNQQNMIWLEPRSLTNFSEVNHRLLLLKLDKQISGTIYQPIVAVNEA